MELGYASLRTVVQTTVVRPPWWVTIALGCCKTKMLMMGELSCNEVHKRKEAFGKCKACVCASARGVVDVDGIGCTGHPIEIKWDKGCVRVDKVKECSACIRSRLLGPRERAAGHKIA